MRISYQWLCEYLPVTVEPEKISRILTAVGLEVENMYAYEEYPGGLKGLVIGEVLRVEKHPNADKLYITNVNTGEETPRQIVCGAPNVAAGQKVIVALPGTTIYPVKGEPLTIKNAKIRGVESFGMICAEDEIGMGTSHDGIMVLPDEAPAGMPASEYFKPYSDIIFEVAVTPNRMEAMSHLGIAREICAYLSHHEKESLGPKNPLHAPFHADGNDTSFSVHIENTKACLRYCGILITGVTIQDSPDWLQKKLKAVGLRPINNVVDITNYILYETGQPLHAFDAGKISGKKIIVKNLPAGTVFTTLDDKPRTLHEDDLMICDEKEGLCMAGVFGGKDSGVTFSTTQVFLESACFDAVTIRKTSFRHGLRTDSAMRFEKGADVSATLPVLKRAAIMIKEICGGRIASQPIDVYPHPVPKKEVYLKWHFLKKLSGKNYHPDAVKNILERLEYDIIKETVDDLVVAVPFHKPDVTLPADIVEEIVRIDGLDHIEIPETVTMTPAVSEETDSDAYREKTANWLSAQGFFEIITNSIVQSAWYDEEEQQNMVKMLNSLNAELNILRNRLLESILQVVVHNLNHKNNHLRLYEFGKAYYKTAQGQYAEEEQLGLAVTGLIRQQQWKHKSEPADIYYLKGILESLFAINGVKAEEASVTEHSRLASCICYQLQGQVLAGAGEVKKTVLEKFDIKQPVYYAWVRWPLLMQQAVRQHIKAAELPRFPSVQRDLSFLVPKEIAWKKIDEVIRRQALQKLTHWHLFDLFEGEKIGAGKKSVAVNFTFRDEQKTLTDKEIDGWMETLMKALQTELNAEIRK
ncbi:MAG: phenylalanine--tRNA ligase subunit beta [Chitinophagaceae bacterium]|nr:phenylalanine--tRNA ligase subunit beta [Chitinophagaceae bacterium]